MSQPLSVTVVIPTFRERENIPLVLARLDALLGEFNWEVVFVDDDSDDGSADVFVHISAVERAGIGNLKEGQKLSFELVKDPRKGKTSAENLKTL